MVSEESSRCQKGNLVLNFNTIECKNAGSAQQAIWSRCMCRLLIKTNHLSALFWKVYAFLLCMLLNFSCFFRFYREYIHFPHYAIYRTIPNVMDGFKPSQRKVDSHLMIFHRDLLCAGDVYCNQKKVQRSHKSCAICWSCPWDRSISPRRCSSTSITYCFFLHLFWHYGRGQSLRWPVVSVVRITSIFCILMDRLIPFCCGLYWMIFISFA